MMQKKSHLMKLKGDRRDALTACRKALSSPCLFFQLYRPLLCFGDDDASASDHLQHYNPYDGRLTPLFAVDAMMAKAHSRSGAYA